MLRCVVKAVAAVFRPDLSQIFSGKGIVFAVESIYKRPESNILVYLFCDSGPMPVEQLRLQFQQRVLNYTDDSGVYYYYHPRKPQGIRGGSSWEGGRRQGKMNGKSSISPTVSFLTLPCVRVCVCVSKDWIDGRHTIEPSISPDT